MAKKEKTDAEQAKAAIEFALDYFSKLPQNDENGVIVANLTKAKSLC